MIELINIYKSFHSNAGVLHALKNVSLTIQKGEIHGVIGKSGAGKSTLIRCINLLDKPTTGLVKVNGQDLNALSRTELCQARHQIGMIFQHFNLLSQSTVYENIALPLVLMGQHKSDIKKTIMPLLELTGLTAKINNYPAELSGGQKQRVAIARAMASNPTILLCDEATSALDQHTTQSILQLLKEINQQFGVTIMLITHEIEVVKQICDRVSLMHHGELIEQKEVFEFFAHPETMIAKELVQSSLRQELPLALQQQLLSNKQESSHAVLRLLFHGKAASEPLIANLAAQFGIKLNILQATIEFLKKDTLGMMIAEVSHHQNQLEHCLHYLTEQGVNTEVIGYVKRHDT